MLFLGLTMVAVFSFTKLPVDLYPEIQMPQITVIINWPGASAEDVEQKLTEVAENQLAIVTGLDEMRSTSQEGVSVIRLKFAYGEDLDAASNDIRDRLDFAADFLPKDINKPVILKFDTAMMPIIFYGVTATTNWYNLYDIADDNIAKELERVDGVGSVQLFGGLEKQVNLKLNQSALIAHNVSLNDIAARVANANLTAPAGDVKIDRMKYTIRVPAEFVKPDEIGGLIIKSNNGADVYMRDVLEDPNNPIELGFAEKTQVVEVDGQEAMMLLVQKRSGANTVEVAKAVQKRMEEIKGSLPKDIKLYDLMDSSKFIKDSISNLSQTAMYGVIFVIIVTLLFLRNIRNTFVVILTMPFSLIIAFIFLFLLGFTINIISLAAIALGVGLVVDDAIVVLENIVRRIEKGERVREASIFGTSEVGTAVTASTFTTVVVFVPLIFLSGLTGIMFKQLAVTVIVTIMASLFCALTLSPMLASKLLKPAAQMLPKNRLLRNAFIGSEKGFRAVESGYSWLLGWALRHKPVVFIVGGLAVAAAMSISPLVGSEFMPAQDTGDLSINFRMQVGTKVEDTQVISREIVRLANEIGGADVIHTNMRAGARGGLTSAFGSAASHIGSVGIKLVPASTRKVRIDEMGQTIIDKIKKTQWGPYINKISYDAGNPMARVMGGGGQDVSVEILGYNVDTSYTFANKVKDIVNTIPGAKNPTVSLELGMPELQIQIDKVRARNLDVDVSTIETDIDTLYRGNAISTFRRGNREYDIVLRLSAGYRRDAERIMDTIVTLPGGRQIALSSVAELKQMPGPVTIERKNRQRIVRVEAAVLKRSAGDVVGDIETQLKDLRAKGGYPQGFDTFEAGSYQDQQKTFKELGMLLIMGVLLVFMVMAAQFESVKQPLIIMFAVPFALVGVIIILAATHTNLSMMSLIGVVLLVGIVVKNAIILLDFTNILRARGLSMTDAIRTAGKTRLRPVLMTTMATILGMLPLAVAPGEGSETWQPMAIAVIGGLSLSTLITLVFVPTLYSVWVRPREGFGSVPKGVSEAKPMNK
jgi:HAE1 family hydrophobic/amphiphilic exporter-1